MTDETKVGHGFGMVCGYCEGPGHVTGVCPELKADRSAHPAEETEASCADCGDVKHQTEPVEARKVEEAWEQDFNMYRSAWIRELGGLVIPKHHDIDALVLTTRDQRERALRCDAAESRLSALTTENEGLREALTAAEEKLADIRSRHGLIDYGNRRVCSGCPGQLNGCETAWPCGTVDDCDAALQAARAALTLSESRKGGDMVAPAALERETVVRYLRYLASDQATAEHDVVRQKHAALLADTIEHGHHIRPKA
jgi:hypothetical protein